MTDITDVRRALWAAYQHAADIGEIEGKSSEAWCEVRYPTFWDADSEEQFLQPSELMVYSYALGPSRQHYFQRSSVDKRVDSNTWKSPDIYAKAVEVIGEWVAAFDKLVAENAEDDTRYAITDAGRAYLEGKRNG